MPRVYHTCASRADLARARAAAPELDHGYGWLPAKMCAHDAPWFLDNGAYRAWTSGEPPIPPEQFWRRLEQVEERMPRDPEFVVLPDAPGDATEPGNATIAHARRFLDDVRAFGYPVYLALHPGVPAWRQVETAAEWDCAGVFLGGASSWAREAVRTVVSAAHTRGMDVHVGRPERAARWMLEAGVDSVDTSGFVRRNGWERLARLARGVADDSRQATLDQLTHDGSGREVVVGD